MSHATLERTGYTRVSGGCMAHRIPDGALVEYDGTHAPRPGDYVVVQDREGPRVGVVAEWDDRAWLVTYTGGPPQLLAPPLEVVGVISQVMQSVSQVLGTG